MLQECAEASGAKTGILCEAARELQQCMTPLMSLNGEGVVEASLLRPTGEELGPSPTLEEENILLGEGDGPLGVPDHIPRHAEIPRFVELAKHTTDPVSSTAPTVALPGKERSHGNGLTLTLITPVSRSELIWRGLAGSQSGWRNFALFSALWMGIVMMPKSKVWLISKLQPSACQPPRGSTQHLDDPTLPGSIRKERIPCPSRPKDDPGLSGGAEGGDSSAGYCAPEVCYPCQSLSKYVLQSSARAP